MFDEKITEVIQNAIEEKHAADIKLFMAYLQELGHLQYKLNWLNNVRNDGIPKHPEEMGRIDREIVVHKTEIDAIKMTLNDLELQINKYKE